MFDLYSENELDKIRSLGKFYESIPDYYDLHHLSSRDFNNTLDRLKQTSNKLKNNPISLDNTNRENKIKKIHSSKETIAKIFSDRNSYNITFTPSTTVSKTLKICNKKPRSCGIKKSYSLSHLYDDIQHLNLNNEWNSPKSNSKDSQNEILTEKPSKCNKIKTTFSKISSKNVSPVEDNKIARKNIFNNYYNNSNIKKKRKLQINSSNNNKLLFLGLNIQKTPEKFVSVIKPISNSTAPSPLYPAARLNLAATLRAEVSHKKRYELSNSASYRPKKNQNKFDWEVRKSPGWKTLTYCESNKDDLLYRLETRKAEQKLQSQEYKTNMELMRQRVKSAPLLLEGMTYWNSRLYNKLSHSCGSGKQSRLSVRCKYLKNSKNDSRHIENNNQNVDSDDLSSEDRALL